MNVDCKSKEEGMDDMPGNEGVDIDLYADDIEQDFNTEEFAGDGVDLYDDVIANSSRGNESETDGGSSIHQSPSHPSTNNSTSAPVVITNNNNNKKENNLPERDGRDGVLPLRKHQAYIGGLTWWTSDQNIKDILAEIGVLDFVDVKFYENRANGQSKGYCILTVGSEPSLRLIHEKLPKKEIFGMFPVVTPPTKQALNQFEAQSKTRPAQGGPPNNLNNQNNMMGGPRGPPMGPMPPGGPMGMGMGYGPPRMMMPMRGPMRGPPGMPPRNMGHPNPQGPPPGPYNSPQRPQMGPGPQNMSPVPGPPQRPPMGDPYFSGGPMGPQGMPPRGGPGPIPQPGMDPRGPPPRQDWARPPMNSYPPPHGQPPPGGPMQGPPSRGPPPVAPGPMIPGPPPPGAPAPHMNPAFFNQGPGPQGPPQIGPGGGYPGGPPPGGRGGPGYAPVMDPRDQVPPINEAEFEEVMSRNRSVSSSAISRAVQDAAAGEFASAIETLVTAISLIKQSKVAHDDRCKILISSLQDTLHGIESKSYGRRGTDLEERSRSRERERHGSSRRRRERSRSRERDYRDRSRERDRYYEYPRERSRSREREYRDRSREDGGATRAYYEERERYSRERPERERDRRVEPDRSRERERDPEVHRATRH